MAAIYAATRNELYKNGKKIEILANFHPKLHYIAEWWKQLYGESEGKDGKGIFPASVDLTTDVRLSIDRCTASTSEHRSSTATYV